VTGRSAAWLAGAVGLAAVATAGAAWAQADRPTPSGLPVPRYVSLKSGLINARQGPGNDYRILWTYRTRGLPVQVIAETKEWRRICDPQGGVAWVNSGTTGGKRTVMRTRPQPLALRSDPRMTSSIKAYMAGRALAELGDCKNGWCKVKLEGAKGWIPAGEVWGADERRQCANVH
jgi:SH3-like domain-containing protein